MLFITSFINGVVVAEMECSCGKLTDRIVDHSAINYKVVHFTTTDTLGQAASTFSIPIGNMIRSKVLHQNNYYLLTHCFVIIHKY